MNKRIYVKKKKIYDLKSEKLLKELNENLNLNNLKSLQIYIIYDAYNIDEELLEKAKYTVFSYKNIDDLQYEKPRFRNYISYESLPLQFDNKADSALQLLELFNDKNLEIKITTGILIGFNEELSKEELEKIKKYLINPIEQREKDLNKLELDQISQNEQIKKINNFINYNDHEINQFIENNNFALSFNQLKNIQKYFISENRNPLYSELMMFNIYWSDHCRHTTFNTVIKNININLENKKLEKEIINTFNHFLSLHKRITKKDNFTLMDLSLVTKRTLNKKKKLLDLEKSNEINAISIEVDVNNEPHYLVFKNETHNHPSELEPFSGASTCLGGAMRDIFASRAYCFAGIRLSGSGNILEKNSQTLVGKLPQNKIAKETAKGFSSFGNQVGLSTQYIDEYYHDSYKAKHLECGAVLGVVNKEWVNKQEPQRGDLIILIGDRTGIDGIGGASGSSKIQDEKSLRISFNEVQKGNPIIARKFQRLYKNNPKFIKMIKRSNDFGAGGASVAIGEIANGVNIFLDKFKRKYLNINPHELLFSESQERMAVVIDAKDEEALLQIIKSENLDGYSVGNVTNNGFIRAFYEKELIVNVSQEFLNKGAYIDFQAVEITKDKLIFEKYHFDYNKEITLLKNKIKKGLIEMFDSTIGGNSKLNTMGGKFLLTHSDVLISKIPTSKLEDSDKNVIVSCGFNAEIAEKSPYHMGFYSLVEAISKMASKQIPYQNAKVSLQEYFPKLSNDEKWGMPLTALLGLYKVLSKFDLPIAGGKDSMSGTYNDIDVIPTIITFLINTFEDKRIITNVLQKEDGFIYLLNHDIDENDLINLTDFKNNIDWFIKQQDVLSSQTISEKSLELTLIHMALGNKVSFELYESYNKNFSKALIGSIVFQTKEKLGSTDKAILIGQTFKQKENNIDINNKNYKIHNIINDLKSDYEKIYPYNIYKHNNIDYSHKYYKNKNKNTIELKPLNQEKCVVLHPIFPGTNCEFDSAKKFSNISPNVINDFFIFKNASSEEINHSINQFANKIRKSDIIMINGGFSLADEPDGSAKYIACILRHKKIQDAIKDHIANKKLILGICNGFQALINSGILPNLKFNITESSPILKHNIINKHISTILKTKYLDVNSPWISNDSKSKIFTVPISHGEGCFNANDKVLEALLKANQIASVYCDSNGDIVSTNQVNPNNSSINIEGIVSQDGLVFGKMGHSERMTKNLYSNIQNTFEDPLFKNGVKYILGFNLIKES